MSVVLGEDPESEEEIDTSQIDQLSNTPSKDVRNKIPRGEVVAGEVFFLATLLFLHPRCIVYHISYIFVV